jgi:transcriptional regulator with XRE-family HTH domain
MESEVSAGTLIREARNSLGYSQYAVAEELVRASGNDSLTREQVARWERGKRIPGPYWRRWICTVLQLPVNDLEIAVRFARDARWRAFGPQGDRAA